VHGLGRLGVDRLRLIRAAANKQVVKERREVVSAQMDRELGQGERLAPRGGPRVGRDTEHARDAEEHLGLLLGRQRVA
jgi:hypothetical protein